MDRLLALPFAVFGVLVVAQGGAPLAVLPFAAAAGLALRQRWGRVLALLLALSSAGFMVVALVTQGLDTGRLGMLGVCILLIVALARTSQRSRT